MFVSGQSSSTTRRKKCYSGTGLTTTSSTNRNCYQSDSCPPAESKVAWLIDFGAYYEEDPAPNCTKDPLSLAFAPLLGVQPTSYKCYDTKSNDKSCQLDSLDEEDADDPVLTYPCERCDFLYSTPSLGSEEELPSNGGAMSPFAPTSACADWSCDDFTCVNNNVNATTDGAALRSSNLTESDITDDSPASVYVCYEWIQSEYYNMLRRSKKSCGMFTQMKTIGQRYNTGVNNVRELNLLLKRQQSSEEEEEGEQEDDEEEVSFGACEFYVDDAKCNSCELCGAKDDCAATRPFAADCSNIASGAILSCDDGLDSDAAFGTIGKSVFTLEDGYVAPIPESSAVYHQGFHYTEPALVAVATIATTLISVLY